MSVSGTARKALEAVQELGGETSGYAVSRRLGTEPGYARLLCLNLAREDYLYLKPSGLFKVTRKGKKALNGEGSVSVSLPGKTGLGKDRMRQDSDWRVASIGNRGGAQRPSFSKPGQEPLSWHTVKTDGSGRLRDTGPSAGRKAAILDEGTWLCGFCRGKGERPAGTKCPVCHGTGMVSLTPPVVVCAFCKGRGSKDPRSYVTCLVCRGRGYVEVEEGAVQCAACRGTGKEKGTNLYCKGCKGKGVVKPRTRQAQTKPNLEDRLAFWQREELRLKIKQAGISASPRASVSGTELEVLKAYCEAEDKGEAPNIPHRTRLMDGYVEILRKKLCEKGVLASVGSRRWRTTDLGREMIAAAKEKEKKVHGF